MCELTKRFRWGDSIEMMLDHLSTPQIKALEKHCRYMIAEMTDPELEGEGYRPTRIIFDMFDYLFLLAFSHDDEEWVLEIDRLPERLPPRARRANRRRKGGSDERTKQEAAVARLRRARVTKLYKRVHDDWQRACGQAQLGRKLNAFVAEERRVQRPGALLRFAGRIKIPPLRLSHASHQPVCLDFSQLSPFVTSIDDLRLVSVPVIDLLGSLSKKFTFPTQTFDGLWDVSWFGELPQPSEMAT